MAITERKADKSFIDRSGVEHEIGYDVNGQTVYEGFPNIDEIMGSQYNTKKKVLYLIKWEGYPEQSEWMDEPLKHLPKKPVQDFHKHHPEAAMDDALKKVRK